MYNTVVIDFWFVFCYVTLISSVYCKYKPWFFMPNQNKVNNSNNTNNNNDNNNNNNNNVNNNNRQN